MTDSLKRNDMRPNQFANYDALAEDCQLALRRAAKNGAAELPDGMSMRIPHDWLIVPGYGYAPVQVAVGLNRAYRL
jgi:hypothetical protein